jgi:tetratricopeptide (TPR) repeat protein
MFNLILQFNIKNFHLYVFLGINKLLKVLMSKILIVIVLFVVGCASTKLDVKTTPPGARIFVESVSGGQSSDIGETPLNINFSQIKSDQAGGAITLRIVKEGYNEEFFTITDTSRSNVTIQKELSKIGNSKAIESFNVSLEKLFRAQKLVSESNFDQALEILKGLSQEIPEVSAIHEMMGGIYFMKKDFSKARLAYRQALGLNSQSLEAKRMLEIMQKAGD